MDNFDELTAKILGRTADVAVIGLGYVGLPLAVLYSQAGFKVHGIERNPDRVEQVNQGRSYIEGVTDHDLAAAVGEGRLCATPDYSPILEADVVTICVPTPLQKNKQPDISYIEHTLEQASPYWHKGQLVVLESTTYPGTTEEVILPSVTRAGLQVGKDIFLAFSPERIDPGNKSFPLQDVPRVVGGMTASCTEVAACFYQQILKAPLIPVSSPRVAEMTKLLENVFRVVNLSLVNELAQLCDRMNIDIWEVIEAAKTKPYGFMPFYPGPGAGGHCIPVDPFYLSTKAKEFDFTTRFIDLAGEINDKMPDYSVSKISEILNNHGRHINRSKILMSGIAFKRDVADTRESAALKIADRLLTRGAILSYHDPHVPSITINGCKYHSVPLTSECLHDYDLVVICADHSNVDYRLIAECSQLVFDTRNALRAFRAKHIYRLGAPEFAG